jgi:hypothetical protein
MAKMAAILRDRLHEACKTEVIAWNWPRAKCLQLRLSNVGFVLHFFLHDTAPVAIDSQYQSLFNFRGKMEDIPLTVTAGSFKRTVTRSSVD